MMGRLASWLSRRKPETASDSLWLAVTDRLPFLDRLTLDERHRLRALCADFLASKEFSAANGLILTDQICLSIAVQACLPILNLGLDWYRNWHGIVVYPDEFLVTREFIDETGVVHRYQEAASGEAWDGGPLLLSWSDVQMTGGLYNVVIHEFAHKIDMLNGDGVGHPRLQKNMNDATWQTIWENAYTDFCRRVDQAASEYIEDEHGNAYEEPAVDSVLDPYAAEAPGEFFAVTSEVFFTAPEQLSEEYPAVYEQLAQFYRQDPKARR